MEDEGCYEYSVNMMRIERAKEELEILESQHPNHYQSLKLEIKSFISFLQNSLSPSPSPSLCNNHPTTSTATTRASSTTMSRQRKRKRKEEKEKGGRGEEQKERDVLINDLTEKDREKNTTKGDSTDRVDLVLGKAHACLTKIRLLKFQLSPS